MTRDNSDAVDRSTGDPGTDLEPTDVIKCRECARMVRRVNSQHLQTDRCMYSQPEDVRVDRDGRDDLLRPDHPTTVEEYREKYPDAPVMSPRESEKLAKVNRDPEVDERRKELMRRRWRGEKMTNIVSSLADRHDVTESAVWKDWADRDRWIARVFGLDDAESVVVESLAQKQDVRKRLLRIARQAEDEREISEAVRALKAVDANIDDTIEHQRKLGNVDQAASEHKVHVGGEVDHEHTHEAVGEDLDKDTLEQLDDITGGGDEEVIDAKYEVVNDEDDEPDEGDGEDGS